MSVEIANHSGADAAENAAGAEITIQRRARDLGGFTVGRVLPYAKRRMVGPFIFFDEMGPVRFEPGRGVDIRPHPHIGLATVTYLFAGEIRHRDSLGSDQIIRPGDVNWMTAGRGIVHSERSDDAVRSAGQHLHGIQSWIALPLNEEETAPDFHHHPAATLPLIDRDGASMRLIAGRAFGEVSPVRTFSDMFYLAIEAEPGASIALPADIDERALYLVSGVLSVDGSPVAPGGMLVFAQASDPAIRAEAPSRLLLLGGANVGSRLIWWNFVASNEEKLETAKRRWTKSAARRFVNTHFTLPPGEAEFIPLP